MADTLRDQLQNSLGTAYTLERELSGGGMAHVFVARDETLGRDVVIKILSIELGTGLSAERFAREIRLAAQLQEPRIVPVLTAGVTSQGLPFYTMPFVRGESLRARLANGPLPISEATSILGDDEGGLPLECEAFARPCPRRPNASRRPARWRASAFAHESGRRGCRAHPRVRARRRSSPSRCS